MPTSEWFFVIFFTNISEHANRSSLNPYFICYLFEKNNLNPEIKSEPVTVRVDATAYVWVLGQKFIPFIRSSRDKLTYYAMHMIIFKDCVGIVYFNTP